MVTRRFEVRDHRRVVDRNEPLDGLQLHDQETTDEQTETAFTYRLTLAAEADRRLAFEPDPSQPKLHGKCVLVYRLEKPGA